MFKRGDLVLVEGMGGKSNALRVWDVRPGGLLLCSENGYKLLMVGKEAPVVGFPLSDVKQILEREVA